MSTHAAGPDNQADKKAYRPPVLIAYGSIAKLTHGATGSFKDATTHTMTPCL